MPRGKERLVLAALIAAAAAVRFTRIGHQSFWLDESYTVDLVQRPFGGLLSGVASDESTPPLYYVLAWLWSQLFGTGEVGLRSLSALIGVATVPVAYVAAARLVNARTGLIVAALVMQTVWLTAILMALIAAFTVVVLIGLNHMLDDEDGTGLDR